MVGSCPVSLLNTTYFPHFFSHDLFPTICHHPFWPFPILLQTSNILQYLCFVLSARKGCRAAVAVTTLPKAVAANHATNKASLKLLLNNVFHKYDVLIFSPWMLYAIPDTAIVISQRP